MKTIRIGCGAGYAGDRWEPAVELLEKGDIDYLVFETLAERTIAREHIDRLKNPERGYNPWLEARMRAVLPLARQKGVKIITSMGAANPRAAAKRVLEIGRELGIASLKVAAVVGDDVTELVRGMNVPIMETGEPFSTLEPRMISANAKRSPAAPTSWSPGASATHRSSSRPCCTAWAGATTITHVSARD